MATLELNSKISYP